jgi:hypothetical protein
MLLTPVDMSFSVVPLNVTCEDSVHPCSQKEFKHDFVG